MVLPCTMADLLGRPGQYSVRDRWGHSKGKRDHCSACRRSTRNGRQSPGTVRTYGVTLSELDDHGHIVRFGLQQVMSDLAFPAPRGQGSRLCLIELLVYLSKLTYLRDDGPRSPDRRAWVPVPRARVPVAPVRVAVNQ
jgi:hypothetical protein